MNALGDYLEVELTNLCRRLEFDDTGYYEILQRTLENVQLLNKTYESAIL